MKHFLLGKWREYGFMCIGLAVVLALSGMLVGSTLYYFVAHSRLSDVQDSQRDMVQNARIALEVLSRELRMAGYNPTGASFDGLVYGPNQLHVRADLNGDGDTAGPDEDIRYTYDAATRQIMRFDRTRQEPLAENIQAFTMTYLDHQGQPATASAHVRQVRLTVTARAAAADVSPATPRSPRTYTLTTLVNLRNGSTVTDYGRS